MEKHEIITPNTPDTSENTSTENVTVNTPVENPVDNVENPAPDYGALLQELNDKMSAILEENEKLKKSLNSLYGLNNNPPPPSEEAVDALTYEQLAEKLVSDPDSYTSHYLDELTKGAQ